MYRHVLAESVARLLLALVLLLAIVFPTIAQGTKMALLVCFVLAVVFIELRGRFKLSLTLYCLSFAYGVMGLIWSFYGLMAGNAGALNVMTVMVFYPIMLPFCAAIFKQGDETALMHVFNVGSWSIIIFDLSYIVFDILFPENLFSQMVTVIYDYYAVVDNSEFYFKFTLPNISSIAFLLPFYISALIFSSGAGRIKDVTICLLLFGVALLSGRRAIFLTMLTGPAIAFVLTMTLSKINPRSAYIAVGQVTLGICALLILTWVAGEYVVGSEYLLSQLVSIFDFQENESNFIRLLQYNALWSEIELFPLFGRGAGAVASVVRDYDLPWSYELFYLSILFQYGFIALTIYAFGILLIIYHLISFVKLNGRASFEFYFLSGFISFLIANATNPYLAKFDYMWVIFVPYALINAKLLNRTSRSRGVPVVS